MQDWATEGGIGNCGKLKTGDIITLLDYRDNTSYKVKKLPDGRCWMVENLTLGSKGGVELTNADTNMPEGSTATGTAPSSGKYYLPPAGYQGNINSSSTKTNTSTVANFSNSNDNQAKLVYKAKGSTDNITASPVPENTVYYNFYTATLGYSYYSSGGTTSPRDICPKGWKLPTGGSGSNFTTLYGILGNWETLTGDYTINNNANFSFAGFITTGSTPDYVGTVGVQWSSTSTYNGSSSAYALSRHIGGNVDPQNSYYKYYGNPVRCVTISSASDYMQNFDSSDLSQNESTILVDNRDGHEYSVKKLPDGKVWMTQNLTLGSPGATEGQRTLTAEKTNIDEGKTFYLPPAGKQGGLTSTTAAYFSDSDDRSPKTYYRSKSGDIVNDSDTMYYNYYTATLGYSYYRDTRKYEPSSLNDICPKGWRLPYAADTNGIVTGDKNDFAYLASQYGPLSGTASSYEYYSDNSNVLNGMYIAAASPMNSNAGFSYSGYANGTGPSYTGTYGMYWTSSTSFDSTNVSYSLFFSSSRVYPQYFSGLNISSVKFIGAAVRCIANTGNYIINYDPNGGIGEMPQSISSDTLTNGKVTLRKNQFTNNNLSFVGWSTNPSATTATYPDETTVYNLGSAGDIVTLYAIWSEPEQMQNWNGCSSLPEGQITALQDSRDNTVYAIKKFSDGSCWMIDNLILGHDKGYALTNELTNIQDSDTETYYLPPAGYQGSINSASTVDSTVAVKFCYSSNCGGDAIAKLHYVPSSNTGYYNFYTATLGKSYYNLNGTISGYLEKDICPKGWQIPTGYTSGSKSWSYFYSTLNNSTPSSMFSNSFRRTGYYYSQESHDSNGTHFSTSLYNTTEGYWWSSTVRNQNTSDTSFGFNLTLNQDSSFNAGAVSDKYKGIAVRCVAK